ncbi:serine integrase [Arthrobacter phage Reedo]|nr:serine integrase [Arthrobacter phage Reedo]
MRAILYTRLSISDDASTSLSRQEADLRALADREGWDVVRVLTDDGISGRKARANAAEALRMLREDEADVLAVWKFDRWSRQGLAAVADLVNTLDAVPSARFVALGDGLNSTQPAWRIIASVLAEVARMEADNTATRVRSSIAALRKSSRFAGGVVPFGYRTAPAPDGPGRILEPNPSEAAIIRELADEILAGASLFKLALDLTARGVPASRSPYRLAVNAGRNPEGLSRGVWKVVSLQKIMTGDALLGRVTHKGTVLTDADGVPVRVWEPILDLPTLTRLRARLAPAEAKPKRVRAARLLSGLVYCSHCGSKCYVRTSGGYPIYGCASRSFGLSCPQPRITATGLEDYVAERFLAVVGDAPEVEEVELVSDPGTAEALAEIEAALQEASTALTADDADLPALMARLASLKARRAELRAIPATLTREILPTGRTLREAWLAEDDVDRRRNLLLEGLDHVKIKMRNRHGKKFEPERVEIFWLS